MYLVRPLYADTTCPFCEDVFSFQVTGSPVHIAASVSRYVESYLAHLCDFHPHQYAAIKLQRMMTQGIGCVETCVGDHGATVYTHTGAHLPHSEN